MGCPMFEIALFLVAALATFTAYDLWLQSRPPAPQLTPEEQNEEWDASQY